MAATFVLFCLALCVTYVHCSILCETGFCSAQINETPCSPTASDCDINNGTFSGMWLPSPTICNCCRHCLPLYNLNSPCSVGGPGSGSTVGRCGDGLTCNNVDRVCVRMKTKCHDAQDDYDLRQSRSQTGIMEPRPECDRKGNFASFTCVPSQTMAVGCFARQKEGYVICTYFKAGIEDIDLFRCFCQSEEGERLFGETTYTGVSRNMPCECSRMIHKIQKNISPHVPYPVRALRCTSDGNFNPVQCIRDTCYCMDKVTGRIIGSNSINLNEKPISELPCYEEDLDLFPPRNATQRPFNYTTPCYESITEREKLIEQSIKEGYNVDFSSSFSSIDCLPDGTFGRMTINSNGSKICVSERGERIGIFEAKPDTAEFDNMDCKCALTTMLMASSSEPPKCCANGNFRPIQCRRGHCYCVDSDGRQVGLQSGDVTRLDCYTSNWRNC